ncbi:hypothetical protein NHX12_004587 [Muraenolepis orangiensis]|uniref:Uncharacterized protein n=1 Tax=Muraenolepis orangiensis TaxID=630683 RepID=A0A9Q0DVS6_9TELE|nr:hypothetical protein NHX12_004587 [Muraenolepis orangiensis]
MREQVPLVSALQPKYQQATKKAMLVQDVMEQMRVQYKLLQEEVLQLMESSTQCLNRLKEIALKPNPLSTPEYIDLLIQGEKSELKEGYLQRIQKLQEMRENAMTMEKMPEMLHSDAGEHGFSHCGVFLLQNAGILLGFTIMLLIAVFQHRIQLDLGY